MTFMNDPVRLLVIDDDKSLLLGLAATLRRESSYQVITADNGKLGIQLAEEQLPHIIICDLMMPPPDGWAVLKALSKNPVTTMIPFIFLTARTDQKDKVTSMELGADDYIIKPFDKDELLARVRAILRRKGITETHERLKSEEEISILGTKIRFLINNFPTDYGGLADAMAQMLSLRDNETEQHGRRVVELSTGMASELGINGEALNHIHLGALLHDVGKVGIPDAILLKPGTLTNEERKIMMSHAFLGKKILEPMGLPPAVLDLVHHHHERWDGSGYPDGLSGENIPLSARIFAIVDVWDALTSDRPYREAWSFDQVIAYITDQAGKHFDPNLLENFFVIINRKNKET
jgi:putative two-component system response regulator